jgi:pimeloyl-ACP methyl ester carboxylesterase
VQVRADEGESILPEPLMLVPGMLCDARLWRHQLESLGDVASPFVADITRDDSVEAMAARVLATAPARFALAGLSLGGIVAQEIMRQAPERVSRLALIDTTARAETDSHRPVALAAIEAARAGVFRGITPRLLPRFIHPDRLDDPTVANLVLEMAQSMGRDIFIRQQRASAFRIDGRNSLEAIKHPTLILCGRQDAITPIDLHEEMHRAIGQSRFVVIEECGHLSALERPQAVSAVLRYWLQA